MPCLHYIEIIATLTKESGETFTRPDLDRLNQSEVFELDPNELKKAPHLVVTDIYDAEDEHFHGVHDNGRQATYHVGFLVETDEPDGQKVADRLAHAVDLTTESEWGFQVEEVEGIPFD